MQGLQQMYVLMPGKFKYNSYNLTLLKINFFKFKNKSFHTDGFNKFKYNLIFNKIINNKIIILCNGFIFKKDVKNLYF